MINPTWSSVSALVDPYASVVLHARAVFTYVPELGTLLVNYRSSTTWWTRDGEEHETPGWVVAQQREMLKQVSYAVTWR